MCDPDNHQAKFCTGNSENTCCHPIEFHRLDMHTKTYRCMYRVESNNWRSDYRICGCDCVICIHLHLERLQEERKAVLMEEQRAIEEILAGGNGDARGEREEILIQEEASKQPDGRLF